MTSIEECRLPETALLHRYRASGAFADCYCTEFDGKVSQAEFVEAFYTSPLFKIERRLLKWFAGRPATDLDARALAVGEAMSFAAWRVEDRTGDELMLADFTGRTRSWLMTKPLDGATVGPRTRLYFGSAVVPVASTGSGSPALGGAFKALLGFHKVYSRWLLQSARSRLQSRRAKADQ